MRREKRVGSSSQTVGNRVSHQSKEILIVSQSGCNFSEDEDKNEPGHSTIAHREGPDRNSVRRNLLQQFYEVGSKMSETARPDGFMSDGSPSPSQMETQSEFTV